MSQFGDCLPDNAETSIFCYDSNGVATPLTVCMVNGSGEYPNDISSHKALLHGRSNRGGGQYFANQRN